VFSTEARGLKTAWAKALLLLLLAPAWISVAARANLPAPLPTTTGFVLVCVLLIAAESDIMRLVIPNRVTLPALITGAVINVMSAVAPTEVGRALGAVGLPGYLLGAAAAFLPFAVMYEFKACGGGDVKLATAIGGLLGPWAGLNALIWSTACAGVAALVLLSLRFGLLGQWQGRLERLFSEATGGEDDPAGAPRSSLPLAPFLAIGTLASLVIDGSSHAGW
jgi:Flp pilus assembly protein protease CpaA